MAALYYSKWAFIEGLLPALRAAHGAGEDAHVAALHTVGRAGRGLKSVSKLVPLASYQDLMAEAFAAHDANAGISFTNAGAGTVDTPLLRASPALCSLPALPHLDVPSDVDIGVGGVPAVRSFAGTPRRLPHRRRGRRHRVRRRGGRDVGRGACGAG
ncbi:hypothetical protein B0H13DRAFT_1993963 [Mycena leptocephala]|nr:hypothetical protein B0H13DRAFT_1993963 [Mycena leptocephala]